MKLKILLFIFVLLVSISLSGQAQSFASSNDCNFKVLIVKDRYLFGKAYLKEEKLKRMKVKFTATVVNVNVPFREKSILLVIENSNCRAYCPRVKRVRQLNSGDRKLLIKLLKKRKKSLLNQLSACNFK
ncbi:hypothetical protein BKI52_33575 [marine bacterium AO1-C]|nr:hypothetical protein BKI52_33575 [marine bacterium AO1-C]